MVIFGEFKNLDFSIFGVFQKNKYLGDMKMLCIFLGYHCKTGLFWGIIYMHFRVFS